MTEFNTTKAEKAQKEYCDKTSSPHFAPYSGSCFACNQNIYEELHGYSERLMGGRYHYVHTPVDSEKGRFTGISVEKAGSELIIGCPHCYRSYCD